MLCWSLNCLSQSAVFPLCGRQVVALQQHLVSSPQIERCHDRDRAVSPAELKERRGAQRSVTKCRRTLRDGEECLRDWEAGVDNRAASKSFPQLGDGVWFAYLQRYLMEGKFTSPTAIRALCFTSHLVKPSSVLCAQTERVFTLSKETLSSFSLANRFFISSAP
ncbi:Hypothetical predicted protein [Xyrichtys novacula]|uniref:Uncharacterized protein n=1 Tax=Xyrichtys novacula TaxID=13765 RepID=A0AAV1FRT8_XYRNO|nr:Hypothetical predicted protein [Xyrichtys novacula]